MGVIVKFPDGRTEEKNIVTMYHEVNGTDYIVVETDKKENENRIVGISFKPQNETLYTSPALGKDWDAAKKVLVDDIHDRKDNFSYVIPQEEILVTENYMHELALRDANYQKLEANYQEFKKAEEAKQEQNVVNPFEQQVAPEVASVETQQDIVAPVGPTIAEVSAPAPEAIQTIAPTPIVDAPVAEIPSAPVDNVIPFPSMEPTPIVDAPVMEAPSIPPVEAPIMETPQEEVKPAPVQEEQKPSIVSKSYMETANDLITQVREVTDKYIKNMEEMKNEIGRQLEEARKINELAKQTFDNAQQIINNGGNVQDLSRDLTKAA